LLQKKSLLIAQRNYFPAFLERKTVSSANLV